MKKCKKIVLLILLCFLLTVLISSECSNKENIKLYNETTLAVNNSNTQNNVINLAGFIRFKDNNTTNKIDSDDSINNANLLFNSETSIPMNTINGIINVPSFKTYYERESYGSLSITTEFFPKINEKVIAYEDNKTINYYLKYSNNNPDGYKNENERRIREKELITNALTFVKPQVEDLILSGEKLDVYPQDGYIDAISFVIERPDNLPSNIYWGDLLWSHQSSNKNVSTDILGKKVNAYTILVAKDYTMAAGLFSLNRGTYGTIIHEFGHVLGYRDLYKQNLAVATGPVGFYDIMGNTVGSNPQNFLTYFTSEYNSLTNWHSPLPTINKSTNNVTLYKPEYKDKSEVRAVKVIVGDKKDEYFIIEYHEKVDTYDNYSAESSGIIIYLVNEKNKYNGNSSLSDDPLSDHIYVFRPNKTDIGSGCGDLNLATLNSKRPTFGNANYLNSSKYGNNTIFFSDGTNSGLVVEVTKETQNSITFNVTYPEMEGDGSLNNPYLIRDTDTFLYLMSSSEPNKYYKLMNDLDFKGIQYSSIDFKGNLDGNNKKVLNITSNSSGLFNNIGDFYNKTKIENLIIENITVNATTENHLGGFANTATNVTLNNIHINGGIITQNGGNLATLASTGGFLGSADNQTIIENCSSSIDITSKKNVGGFIGINQNAVIKNSYANSKVSGNDNIGAFIGLQVITDSVYNVPQNAFFNNKLNTIAVGGYVKNMHNLNALSADNLDLGIYGINVPEIIIVNKNSKIEIPISTDFESNLTYQVNIDDMNLAKYFNGKIEGIKAGTTQATIEVNIGTIKMPFICQLKVQESTNLITEEEFLNILNIKKVNNYVVGFAYKTNLSEIANTISKDSRIQLKYFTNSKGIKINDGAVATGNKIIVLLNNIEYTYTIVIKGDVDGDGNIYATDYVRVRNHIMGASKLDDANLLAADVNNDNNIFATDYVRIKNFIMKGTAIPQI